MIEVNELTKVYKLSKKQMAENKTKNKMKKAADGISFTAHEGEIFGLLGPNGAGKTTTLRTIATLIKPTSGQVTVQGYDVRKDSEKVRRSIGFLTNDLKLDKHFTPDYTFHYFGELYGMSRDAIEARKKELFDYFGITEYQHKKIGELSTGMGQKISIAISLVHNPEVVIFDEPTNGLDIITARAVVDYLQVLKEQGKLVIVSTHIMTVAEKLCDRVAIIIEGKKVIEGTISDVLKKTEAADLEDAFFALYSKQVKEVI